MAAEGKVAGFVLLLEAPWSPQDGFPEGDRIHSRYRVWH